MFQVYAFYVVVLLAVCGFGAGYLRAWQVGQGSRRQLHSTPAYHGAWVFYCVSLPALVLLLIAIALQGTVIDWLIWRELPTGVKAAGNTKLAIARLQNIAANQSMFTDIKDYELSLAAYYVQLRANSEYISGFATIFLAIILGVYALTSISPSFRARNQSERIAKGILWLASIIAILTTIGIVFSLITEALIFFSAVSPIDFFFGADWKPITAIRSDQPGQEGSYGILPVLLGSFVIAIFAMFVAGPIGLLSAIYMVEFADPKVRAFAKPAIEFLAGIPTVVYGFFAAVTVAPLVRDVGAAIGIDASSESALAAGSVMGIMIIPFVSSLADDVISAVPMRLRQAAYSLGATHAETIIKVVLPAALPGLLSAFVLAVSRAIGETMIVVMAAGLAANLTLNPFEAVTTITVQITTVLTGDQPFDSPMTLSAFALGLTLFVLTLALNILGFKVMQHYREKYE